MRFRRWNRKGYAAFASMGRVVTIGCVHKSIAEAALRKQDRMHASGKIHHTNYPDMTIEELKTKVLAGIDLSPEEAA